jgi:hypothetical protein
MKDIYPPRIPYDMNAVTTGPVPNASQPGDAYQGNYYRPIIAAIIDKYHTELEPLFSQIGGVESLLGSLAGYLGRGCADMWTLQYGAIGEWIRLMLQCPPDKRFVVLSCEQLGLTDYDEDRLEAAFAAGARLGLELCSFGSVPAMLLTGAKLRKEKTEAARTHARVVICTELIGDSDRCRQLFAYANARDGKMQLRVTSFAEPDCRIMEMFADDGIMFIRRDPVPGGIKTTVTGGGTPRQSNIAFMFAIPDNMLASSAEAIAALGAEIITLGDSVSGMLLGPGKSGGDIVMEMTPSTSILPVRSRRGSKVA